MNSFGKFVAQASVLIISIAIGVAINDIAVKTLAVSSYKEGKKDAAHALSEIIITACGKDKYSNGEVTFSEFEGEDEA